MYIYAYAETMPNLHRHMNHILFLIVLHELFKSLSSHKIQVCELSCTQASIDFSFPAPRHSSGHNYQPSNSDLHLWAARNCDASEHTSVKQWYLMKILNHVNYCESICRSLMIDDNLEWCLVMFCCWSPIDHQLWVSTSKNFPSLPFDHCWSRDAAPLIRACCLKDPPVKLETYGPTCSFGNFALRSWCFKVHMLKTGPPKLGGFMKGSYSIHQYPPWACLSSCDLTIRFLRYLSSMRF